jgi:hypothetical protein
MTKFSELPQFSKELKRLAKKYPSLAKDLEEFKRVIATVPEGNGKHFAILISNDQLKIIKARLFCRYLKGSVLRIVYAFCTTEETIDFIELYPKNEKPREDESRIKEYLKGKI